ncbi:MobP3 family relaxase [Desulfitobacterium hafniense]|uniref:Sel1 domain protein repeat-containing protein n=1 Tax=Desulfitobacterium hafniense (strain Y51) TaxID=138119 RepID=Q24NR5_DESHY|nr:MobP3 family relaxase [Desulfitobacterium hafniense]BAE86327.1 hypothetical protein DSY4538 [Desulfitobacterium hafniense Y51]
MPRIIFKCGYIKNAAQHLENMVVYVATREGVEKISPGKGTRSVTQKQKQLIENILSSFPDSVRLFEYGDYLSSPTVENASEFITAALDQNLDQLSHQEVYVNYIATRPRTEKLSTHGLFTDEDTPLVLSKVAEEVAKHAGNVWTPIISLRREDAVRLGYDNAAAWTALIRKQRNAFAEQMKIDPVNLRWYAAFHNEGHHPHCHMIIYSVNPREGYVTKPAIEKMRSSLAREIFQQDLIQIYSEQTARRSELAEQSRHVLQEILIQMQSGTCANSTIEQLLSQLAEKMKHTSGKKQYGYLKAPLKELVNQIVDELAKDARVVEAYAKWHELRNEVLRTYKDNLPDPLSLSQQKELKQIKNLVIAEAMNIGSHHFTFEGDEEAEVLAEVFNEETIQEVGESNVLLTNEEQLPPLNEPVDEEEVLPASALEQTDVNKSSEDNAGNPHIAWSKRYKAARTFFYGTDKLEPDFEQALNLFLAEANSGNALAMHDLGRMYADGLGVEVDREASFAWYQQALTAFSHIEAEKENRYVEYRIGKMYAAGLGTEQDYEKAAGWFEPAASSNHKFAQYSLGGLYFRGQGVDQSFETAFELYRRSAVQHIPYASYELAKMYRDGIGAAKNAEEAKRHFREAFHGFRSLEKQSHDDKLQYRLGYMLYTGTGTEKDVAAAVEYLEKAARLGNVHAQYMLGKIYLDAKSGYENIGKAIQWLTKAAESGNSLAQYALGKLYRDGHQVGKDIGKALALFTLAAEQDNEYAAYALGKLFLVGTDVPKDVEAAVKWLTASAQRGNQYAQYTLGKLFLMGRDLPRDRDAAIRWLTLSAEQGNIYAQFFLDHLDSFSDPSLFQAATRLLHHLSRILQELQRKLPGGRNLQADSKLRRKLRQKKIAQGHAQDDHELRPTTY